MAPMRSNVYFINTTSNNTFLPFLVSFQLFLCLASNRLDFSFLHVSQRITPPAPFSTVFSASFPTIKQSQNNLLSSKIS